jgi:octopine/nopaline transport system substrate-binding protein
MPARRNREPPPRGERTETNRMKLFAIAAMVATLGSAVVAQQAPTSVTIATEGAYAPWNFTNADGTLTGFEIDLAKDLCARMKIECMIIAQDWDGLIPSLTVGKYDAIMASMFITDKRLEVIDFSRPYAVDPSGFAVARGGPLAEAGMSDLKFDLGDEAAAQEAVDKMKPLLKGLVIGAQAGTTNLAFVQKYFADTVEIREYKTTEQHDLDLAAGRIDGIFSQQTALAATLAKPEFADFTVAGPGFVGGVFGRGTGAGMRKEDTALKAMFDTAIGEAMADGTIRRLSMQWFGSDVTPLK